MQRTTKTLRAGVTLIELLVVVTILVMLMAYATSIVKPTLEDRKSRESAQLLNSYFTNAQAKAAELGRPVGVYLERSPNDDNKVLQMYTAVSPPPFIGSVTQARARSTRVTASDTRAITDTNTGALLGFDVDGNSTVDTPWIYRISVTDASGQPDLFVSHPLIKKGDTVKFDFKGRTFQILNVAPSNATPTPRPVGEGVDQPVTPPLLPGQFEIVALDDDAMRNGPEPSHLLNSAVPFQIFRGPQKSIAAPIELPTGMAIDLIASGFGADGNQFRAATPAVETDDLRPVVIMYRAGGDLDYVYFNGTKIRPIQPLHLLVGSFEFSSVTEPVGNLADARNRWITIRPRGGDVFATKVHIDEVAPPNAVDALNIDKSRLDIRQRQRRP